MNDLAAQHPEKVRELVAKWNAAAEKYGVFPLDDRNLIIKMSQDRMRRGLRPKWELRPPMERLSAHVSPNMSGYSHEITAEVVRPAGKGDGVLLACGSQAAGYVLHITGGKLYYEQSLFPWTERIESSEALPEGELEIGYVQTMTSRPFEGSGALFVNKKKVADYKFIRTLVSTSYDGFSLGADLGNRVSTLYRGPHPFQGRIKRVLIDIDTTPFSTMEQMNFINALAIRV
jgi:hypothetical protein